MNIRTLMSCVDENAALRRRQRLQPAGGKGDKVFPATYPGEQKEDAPRHVYELRRLDGNDTWCALVDSVQSQANRLEQALLYAAQQKSLPLPRLVVDFSDTDLPGVVPEISSLDAPHRVYDAIFRDSLLGTEPFMDSDLGNRLAAAGPDDASAILETSPTALVFGSWHSTGVGGGMGAKFARCLTSEIIAVGVPIEKVTDRRTGEVVPRTAARRTGSRIDPLGVQKKVEVFKGEGGWHVDKERAGKGAKKVRPSEINHGNFPPSIEPLGVTCDYLEHMFVLSFAGLRRLHFHSADKDKTGRTLLATLGILALIEQDAQGYALRSRCDLVMEGRAPFEVVHADGSTEEVVVDQATARTMYNQALANAVDSGFHLNPEPIRLRPQPKLVEIVRRSQLLALAGRGGEGDDQ